MISKEMWEQTDSMIEALNGLRDYVRIRRGEESVYMFFKHIGKTIYARPRTNAQAAVNQLERKRVIKCHLGDVSSKLKKFLPKDKPNPTLFVYDRDKNIIRIKRKGLESLNMMMFGYGRALIEAIETMRPDIRISYD